MSMASARPKIRDRDWDILLGSIIRKTCVPLIGPDLNVECDEESKNFAVDLAFELAETLKEEKRIEVADPHNLSLCAQQFQNHLSRDDLTAEAKRFYDQRRDGLGDNDPTFRAIAALPFSLFVTSRHDETLEHYLRLSGKNPTSRIYNMKGSPDALGQDATIDNPIVYHLYGSFSHPESLVLTENDLLDFLKAVVAKEPGLPNDLLHRFQEQNFLFLGFGLVGYHLRVLLHVLELNKDAKSFAFETSPSEANEAQFAARFDETVMFYNELGYNALKLLNTGASEFATELHTRWRAKETTIAEQPASAEGRRALIDGPSVFISHVKENAPFALDLEKRLSEVGFDPWIDEEGIRTGDRWDKTIESVINEVDYFILSQSRELGEREETYVHKEVKLALARNELVTRKFIFPVNIDDTQTRHAAIEDEKIHSRPLVDFDAHLPGLVSDIRREQQRRLKK